MATKNVEVTKRILEIIEKMGGRKIFANKSKTGLSTINNYFNTDNYGRVPEWPQLIKISKVSNKSIDFLLTGEDFQKCSFCGSMEERVKNACQTLDELLKSEYEKDKKVAESIIELIKSHETPKKGEIKPPGPKRAAGRGK